MGKRRDTREDVWFVSEGSDEMECPECNGTGRDPYDGGQCDRCAGTGEISREADT